MTVGSILLGTALFIVVVAFLARPFFQAASQRESSSERVALLQKKDVLLNQIKQLEFDFASAKIPEADYQIEREKLVHQAAQVLKQFESSTTHFQPDDPLNAKIETAIAQLRGKPPKKSTVVLCPSCHQPTLEGQKFCPQCGVPLTFNSNEAASA